MTSLITHADGGYEFAPSSATYSGGVRALPDYALVHAILRVPVAYIAGFDLIARYLHGMGRPMQALCGVELRVAAPFPTTDDFGAFNRGYADQLSQRGLQVAGYGPMARTNVAPLYAAPVEPSIFAFSYTVPDSTTTQPMFVLAGAGDILGDTADTIVRRGETTADALREKADAVMGQLAAGLTLFGLDWGDATGINLYTAHALEPMRDALFGPLGPAALQGLHYYPSRPPIAEVEVELDVRGVAREEFIASI